MLFCVAVTVHLQEEYGSDFSGPLHLVLEGSNKISLLRKYFSSKG